MSTIWLKIGTILKENNTDAAIAQLNWEDGESCPLDFHHAICQSMSDTITFRPTVCSPK